METSAKTALNVNDLFLQIGKILYFLQNSEYRTLKISGHEPNRFLEN